MIEKIKDAELVKFLKGELNRFNLVKKPLDENTLSHIRYANISSWDIRDLSGIEGCVKLNHLYMANTEVSDLSPLLELDNLIALDISMNPQVDWSKINQPFETVKGLSLRSCELKSDEILKFFPNVINVSLFDNQISKIKRIHLLKKLEAVDLQHNLISKVELESFYNITGLGTISKSFLK